MKILTGIDDSLGGPFPFFDKENENGHVFQIPDIVSLPPRPNQECLDAR